MVEPAFLLSGSACPCVSSGFDSARDGGTCDAERVGSVAPLRSHPDPARTIANVAPHRAEKVAEFVLISYRLHSAFLVRPDLENTIYDARACRAFAAHCAYSMSLTQRNADQAWPPDCLARPHRTTNPSTAS